MKTKLTLSLDKRIIEKGKRWARKSGKSLSAVIEEFLEKKLNTNSDEGSAVDNIREIVEKYGAPTSPDNKADDPYKIMISEAHQIAQKKKSDRLKK